MIPLNSSKFKGLASHTFLLEYNHSMAQPYETLMVSVKEGKPKLKTYAEEFYKYLNSNP